MKKHRRCALAALVAVALGAAAPSFAGRVDTEFDPANFEGTPIDEPYLPPSAFETPTYLSASDDECESALDDTSACDPESTLPMEDTFDYVVEDDDGNAGKWILLAPGEVDETLDCTSDGGTGLVHTRELNGATVVVDHVGTESGDDLPGKD